VKEKNNLNLRYLWKIYLTKTNDIVI
jgi:hypothetical protein